MVTNRKQHSSESRVKQASNEAHSKLNKIGASTPYDFSAKNLTPYGGLLPAAAMLDNIGFQKLVEDTVKVDRTTKVMSTYQFILAIVIGIYIGFARINQLRYIARDPLLAGILKVTHLPPSIVGIKCLWSGNRTVQGPQELLIKKRRNPTLILNP
jgi:hypothetical protein